MKTYYYFIAIGIYLGVYLYVSENMIDICRQYNLRGYYYILPSKNNEWRHNGHLMCCLIFLPCDVIRTHVFGGVPVIYVAPLMRLNSGHLWRG